MRKAFLSCLLMLAVSGCLAEQQEISEQSPVDFALSAFKCRKMSEQEIADGWGPPRQLYGVGETYSKGVVLVRSVVLLDSKATPMANLHIAVTDTAGTARALAKGIAAGANKIGDTPDTKEKVGDVSYSNAVCKLFSRKNVFVFVITQTEQASSLEIAKQVCSKLEKGGSTANN